jgi:hypothetical protein
LEEWPLWFLIGQGITTLRELETDWVYDDVVRAIDYVRVKQDLEKQLGKRTA